jgi:toxin-antitoxin system PIN domain toxin
VKARFLLDVNVLVAMSWPTHPAYERAQEWFSNHARAGWATCPMTQTAFVRIVSNPAFSVDALSPTQAVAALQANLSHRAHSFWPDDLQFHETIEPLTTRLSGHKQVTDAYLLGLAIHKKAKLATLDQSILALLPEKHGQREFIELI